jgi:pimeloyl-ACP methyl ester carboxylesterase
VWPMLGLFSSLKTTFLPTFAQWQYAIANGLPLADQQSSYESLAAPESKKLIRQALSRHARVDFNRPHAPLLFLAGGADRIMPAALNRANYRRYRHTGSVTEYRELPGRSLGAELVAGTKLSRVGNGKQSITTQADGHVPTCPSACVAARTWACRGRKSVYRL